MKVFTTDKPTSWPDRLQAMAVGEEIFADFSKKNTVRAAINRVSVLDSKVFTTKKILVKDTTFLSIKRTE